MVKQRSKSNKPLPPHYLHRASQTIAINKIAREFLSFSYTDTRVSEEQIKNRENLVMQIIQDAGGSLDADSIKCLFTQLESLANQRISEVAALAQTIDPDKVKEHFPTLPNQLIENSKLALKSRASTSGKKGAAARDLNRPQEQKDRKIRVHEKWLEWQQKRSLYKSQGEFASEMLKTNSDLSYSTIITKWIPEWQKLQSPS